MGQRAIRVDPSWLGAGSFGAQFEELLSRRPEMAPKVLAIVLDEAVNGLPEAQGEAVQMVVMAGMSYRQASDLTGVNKGTLHRRVQAGLEQIERALRAPWVQVFIGEHLPDQEDEGE